MADNENQNPLHEITHIAHLEPRDNVNGYLKFGWRLLEVLKKHDDGQDYATFVVGWPRTTEPVHPPRA